MNDKFSNPIFISRNLSLVKIIENLYLLPSISWWDLLFSQGLCYVEFAFVSLMVLLKETVLAKIAFLWKNDNNKFNRFTKFIFKMVFLLPPMSHIINYYYYYFLILVEVLIINWDFSKENKMKSQLLNALSFLI